MGYYIDLATITLDAYKEKIRNAYLPPSRAILKERLDERFGHFAEAGIKNLKELQQTLRKKDKFDSLSKENCFKGDYLVILLREINSTLPKPNKISDFIGITAETAAKLEKVGIKNTQKLYDKVKTPQNRNELSKITGISSEIILELTKLTDLSRIKWVGATFARMLHDIGVDTIEKACSIDPNTLYEKINQINKDRNYYKGQIGLNDMRIFVNAAKEVPQEILY